MDVHLQVLVIAEIELGGLECSAGIAIHKVAGLEHHRLFIELLVIVVATFTSLVIPGGITYGIGILLPFSS